METEKVSFGKWTLAQVGDELVIEQPGDYYHSKVKLWAQSSGWFRVQSMRGEKVEKEIIVYSVGDIEVK